LAARTGRAGGDASGLEFVVRVFGELETVVMARLWDLGGDATVREVLERIQLNREIAYTTVLSTMENLHRKGHLTREREGKANRYRTALSRAEHTAGLMREALSSNDEDAETVLTHFVGEMSTEDLDRLRAVVARRGEGSTGR
jgi:predicted transcriptional regulator